MQASFDPDSAAAWQVRLFKKSYAEQKRLRSLRDVMLPTADRVCLDIGGGNGVVPLILRQGGGSWVSAETRDEAVTALAGLFGEEGAFRLEGSELPFEDDTFDTVVVLDGLERIQEDAAFLKEVHRCLKPQGELLIHAAHVRSMSLNRALRRWWGLTDKEQGRVREGYNLARLYDISKDGYDIVESRRYGGFFVASMETKLRLFTKGSGGVEALPPTGDLSQQDLRKFATRLRVHALMYPFFKLAAGLDRLLPFPCADHLVVKLRPRPWLERRGVRMRDGRSIADAAINTKIGSAADLTDPKNNRS